MFLKSINISKLLWEYQLNALTVKITDWGKNIQGFLINKTQTAGREVFPC